MLRQTLPKIKKRTGSSLWLTLLIKNVTLSSTEEIQLVLCFYAVLFNEPDGPLIPFHHNLCLDQLV